MKAAPPERFLRITVPQRAVAVDRRQNPAVCLPDSISAFDGMDEDVWNEQVAQGYDESSAHMYTPDVLDLMVDVTSCGRGPAGGPGLV